MALKVRWVDLVVEVGKIVAFSSAVFMAAACGPSRWEQEASEARQQERNRVAEAQRARVIRQLDAMDACYRKKFRETGVAMAEECAAVGRNVR